MKHPSYDMSDAETQAIVLKAIIEVCEYKKWLLLAAHAGVGDERFQELRQPRTNHNGAK